MKIGSHGNKSVTILGVDVLVYRGLLEGNYISWQIDDEQELGLPRTSADFD